MPDFDRETFLNEQLSKHFRRYEFACKGCRDKKSCPYGHNYGAGLSTIDTGLLNALEQARLDFDAQITITSGHRCPEHNRNQGGARRSQHLIGMAADIKVAGHQTWSVYQYFNKFWTGGLGFYPKQRFVHVDRRAKPSRF